MFPVEHCLGVLCSWVYMVWCLFAGLGKHIFRLHIAEL